MAPNNIYEVSCEALVYYMYTIYFEECSFTYKRPSYSKYPCLWNGYIGLEKGTLINSTSKNWW